MIESVERVRAGNRIRSECVNSALPNFSLKRMAVGGGRPVRQIRFSCSLLQTNFKGCGFLRVSHV
jgi:hypothetical protein